MRPRRRFFWFAHGLTALAHVVPTLALAGFLPVFVALSLGALIWLGTARRLSVTRPDRRRPRWVTLLVDEPLFCHWAACVLGMAFLPIATFALAVGIGSGVFPPSYRLADSLRQGACFAYLVGFAFAAWGTWGLRRWVRVRRIRAPIRGLAPEFDGYRIVQLSDLHVGSFDPKSRAERWVELANELEPDLVAVTGDLVSSGIDFYDDVADALGQLNAKDGVMCVLGNHDQWDDRRLVKALSLRGICVLQNSWQRICRSHGAIIIAGLDDAYTAKADLEATLSGRPASVPTILLSHYPRYFAAAVRRGVALVLSGHTHGGQLGVPFIADRINLATLSGQRGRGLFKENGSLLYVNAGLGTTGPPIRLGVPPEIAVIELCRG